MNTHVGRIARRKARLGGFVTSPSPSLENSVDEDGEDGDDGDDEDDEDDASSSIVKPLI